jgi:hypothetical protein
MIITDSLEGGIIIDSIFKVYTVKNLKMCVINRDKWEIETYEHHDNTNYFFIFEHNTSAIAHWVYESAIYLELFIKLKQKYGNIKLVISGKKVFKKLFLNIFNIFDDDILYLDNNDSNKTEIPSELSSNTCIIPSPISNLLSPTCHDLWQKQLIRFIEFFSRISIENTESVDYLIMPRQTKENYQSNNRIIDFSNIINFFNNSSYKTELLNTDTVTTLVQQIEKVRSARNIILTDGGAFSLNLLFCKNKTFYVITRQSELQQVYYPMAKLQIDTLCSFNNNKYIYFNDQDDFLRSITTPKN